MDKLAKMHAKYGEANGQCKDCKYFARYECGGRILKKCVAYGTTASAATDWAGTWRACGLFPDWPFEGEPVMNERNGREPEEPLPGQTTIFDFLKGEE